MEKINVILIILTISLLSSCGDMFMKETDQEELTLAQFAKCDLDILAFSEILKKNIESDILCLKDKMDMFVNLVDTDRPGYVSKSVLKEFMVSGPIDIEPDTIEIVDSVFDLSHLIIGTDKEYIKNTDIDVLLDFLVYFNIHMRETYKYFTSQDDINYGRHLRERHLIFSEFTLIADKLKSIYKKDRAEVATIDLQSFIFNFFKNSPETLETIRNLLFLKRVFVGGVKTDITSIEFESLLEDVPEIAQIAFDLAKLNHYTFIDEQSTLIKVFIKDLDILKGIIHFPKESEEAVFTIYDFIKGIESAGGDLLPFTLSDYPKEVMKLKEIFLGDGSEIVFSKDLYKLIEHLENIFLEGNLGYRIYDFFKAELNSPDKISHDLSAFPVSTSNEQIYLDRYAKIANNYKFFKGSFSTPYYKFKYYRNPNAFFEITTIEYAIKVIMAHYGQENTYARGGYDMTLEQSLNMIKDFKWFLKDQGLVTIGKKGGGELEGVNNNFVLLSTLFQYQSDGCDEETSCLEPPEATEFVITMLTAIGLKDFFVDEMLKLCATELDMYQRINPSCFRRNFINVINTKIPKDGRSIAEFMPGFSRYLSDLTADIEPGADITESEDYMHFMQETEAFTRTCIYYDSETKAEEVPLKANDAFAVFAGLLNVESTVIRYDLDQNGKMDYYNSNGENEVMSAYYSTYEGAIKALVAPDGGFMEMLAKPIFKYLIKHGEVPDQKNYSSIWKFIKFVLSKSKNADAHRVTIATVLKVIGEQKELEDPHPFKCEECLRDPTVECAPESDDWIKPSPITAN